MSRSLIPPGDRSDDLIDPYSLNQQRGHFIRRNSFSMDPPIFKPRFDETTLGYYLALSERFVRIPEFSGEDIKANDEIELQRLRDAAKDGVDWIIIELDRLQMEPEDVVRHSNHLDVLGTIAGVFGIVVSRVWPRYRSVFLPLTVASVIASIIFHFYSKNPMAQYEVESDRVQLTRFPIAKFPPDTIVLRRKGTSGLRVRNGLIAVIALLSTCYTLWKPPPPCICKWKVLDLLREQEMAKIRDKYAPGNFT